MRILHVENNDGSAAIFCAALQRAEIPAVIHRVSDREQAIQFLRHYEQCSDTTRLDVVFLDLDIPKKDGWAVLTEMQVNRYLQSIPVIALSGAFRKSDQEQAMELGAQQYIEKPMTFKLWIDELRNACSKLLTSH